MKINPFFNLVFLGILQGFSQSFFYLIPLVVLVYLFFLKKIILAKSFKESFLNGWTFGFGFFFGSMHWMVNPFLIYQKHFVLFPLGLIVFPVAMGLFFVIPTVSIFLAKKTKIFKEEERIHNNRGAGEEGREKREGRRGPKGGSQRSPNEAARGPQRRSQRPLGPVAP